MTSPSGRSGSCSVCSWFGASGCVSGTPPWASTWVGSGTSDTVSSTSARCLRGGGFRPVNGFHPSLSYLPQAAVLWVSEQLHELTGNPIFEVFARRGFTSTTYFLCRLTQVVMGTLSLLMTFVIGRRLAGSRVGLLAAFLLSIVPWHIRQSVIFKPDILLVLTTLIAFYLSMRAVSRPSLGSYLAAGAAIGLALSSKFNAGPIAIPLTVAAFWLARQDRRHLLWLISAGATSVVVFLALNPYVLLEPDIYRRSFAKTLRDYERKGEVRGGGSHLNQLVHCVESLLSKEFHGKVLGSLGLVGMVAAVADGLRKHRGSMRSLYWVMLVSYVVGYVVIYALTTANPSAHNWLTLTPFVALSAAWLLVELWRLAAGRVRLLARSVGSAHRGRGVCRPAGIDGQQLCLQGGGAADSQSRRTEVRQQRR